MLYIYISLIVLEQSHDFEICIMFITFFFEMSLQKNVKSRVFVFSKKT